MSVQGQRPIHIIRQIVAVDLIGAQVMWSQSRLVRHSKWIGDHVNCAINSKT